MKIKGINIYVGTIYKVNAISGNVHIFKVSDMRSEGRLYRKDFCIIKGEIRSASGDHTLIISEKNISAIAPLSEIELHWYDHLKEENKYISFDKWKKDYYSVPKSSSGFKLPEKWAVKVTASSKNILENWRRDGMLSVSNGYCLSSHHDLRGYWVKDLEGEGAAFKEITFDQFKEYVLKGDSEPKASEPSINLDILVPDEIYFVETRTYKLIFRHGSIDSTGSQISEVSWILDLDHSFAKATEGITIQNIKALRKATDLEVRRLEYCENVDEYTSVDEFARIEKGLKPKKMKHYDSIVLEGFRLNHGDRVDCTIEGEVVSGKISLGTSYGPYIVHNNPNMDGGSPSDKEDMLGYSYSWSCNGGFIDQDVYNVKINGKSKADARVEVVNVLSQDQWNFVSKVLGYTWFGKEDSDYWGRRKSKACINLNKETSSRLQYYREKGAFIHSFESFIRSKSLQSRWESFCYGTMQKATPVDDDGSSFDFELGDYVAITKSSDNWNPSMDEFAGKVVRITRILGNNTIKFNGDDGWSWSFKNKHFRKATLDEVINASAESATYEYKEQTIAGTDTIPSWMEMAAVTPAPYTDASKVPSVSAVRQRNQPKKSIMRMVPKI